MKILITSGLSESDIGGPFQYAKNLALEFEKMGHKVQIASYGRVERKLPIFLRHLYFCLKILLKAFGSDHIIALDTISVGGPSLLLSKLLRRKITIRIGGDSLWDMYVERTGNKITLRQFNLSMPPLNIKEKIIFNFLKLLCRYADKLAFNTEWQKEIWQKTYNISPERIYIVRNYIPTRNTLEDPKTKNFLWAGRKINLKNLEILQEIFQEIEEKDSSISLTVLSGVPHGKLQDYIKESYALILPSFSDVCPNLILEGASFGKPFIMTEETGLREILDKGGIFVDPFDKIAIKNAIIEMTTNYKKYQEELNSLKSRSWQEVAKEFASLF